MSRALILHSKVRILFDSFVIYCDISGVMYVLENDLGRGT